MNFFVIDNIDAFNKHKTEWDMLCADNRDFVPFQCYGWYEVWFKHFLGNNKLAIVTGYCERDLKVIAPLYLTTSKVRGIKYNKLELIGNTYSPIRNFIYGRSTDAERECWTVDILKNINDLSCNWDVLDLSCIPEENNIYDIVLQSVKSMQLPYLEYTCYADWYQDSINVSWEEYLSQIPVSMRKDMSYCRRRLEREGSVSFSLIKSPDKIDGFIDQYYYVYSKSWQKQEGLGPSFHRDLAKMAAERGWLRLGFLYYNETPIASQFWVVADGTAYILKTVYDQQFKKFSPGKLLTSEMMKSAVDIDKVAVIDYVQGDEEYKKHWTPRRRERRGIYVYNSTIRGRSFCLAQKTILPLLRRNKVVDNHQL